MNFKEWNIDNCLAPQKAYIPDMCPECYSKNLYLVTIISYFKCKDCNNEFTYSTLKPNYKEINKSNKIYHKIFNFISKLIKENK